MDRPTRGMRVWGSQQLFGAKLKPEPIRVSRRAQCQLLSTDPSALGERCPYTVASASQAASHSA
jgi:hypothetical protein